MLHDPHEPFPLCTGSRFVPAERTPHQNPAPSSNSCYSASCRLDRPHVTSSKIQRNKDLVF